MKAKIKGDTVRWGILGVGDVCEVKSAPAMQKIAHSEIVAVMRRNGKKAKDYAQRHGIATWYDDADALIADPNVNAIYIATPPDAHAELTKKVAMAGKPVYVEKPMARTTEECQAMLQVCKAAVVPLYVAYYRRRLPNFEKVKALVNAGVLGEVRMVNITLFTTDDTDKIARTDAMPANWRVDPQISGGGYFFDLASHQFDFLDYLFGPIASVSGHAANQAGHYEAADSISASFRFENGVLGTGSWCFSTPELSEKDELCIIGTKGQLKFAFFGAPKITLETSDGATETMAFEMPQHIQQPLIKTVVEDLLGTDSCPSTGDTAIRTNRVMEEITKDYYTKAPLEP